MSRRTVRLLALVALGATATACSSAPAPAALDQPGGSSTGAVAPATTTGTAPGSGGTTGATTTTGAAPATTGTTGAVAPGTGTSGAGGGATGGKTGAGTSGAAGTGGSTGSMTGGLFTPAEDRIGITPSSITMCAHAALTYAPAFKTRVQDLNVFWTAVNTEKGGIFGRKVDVTYENDNYTAADAHTAATTCIAKKVFMLLGGIGFDQIPTVRNDAERTHTLYLHHTATINGSQGLKYSFSELPTVERTGEAFGQLALSKYRNLKIGILKRDSPDWEPGVKAFKALAARTGLKVVDEEKAAVNAGNYTSQLTNLRNAGTQLLWVWLNAVETTEVITQMKSQQWAPHVMVFPFNLTSQTLGSNAMNPPLDGVAMYPAFSAGDYSGSFAHYADDMKEFEAQYAKYDPQPDGPDLTGVAGDLLFLNWTAQKALYRQLLACGKDCTRNAFVNVLQHYDQTPISSACPIDFVHGDHHHGSQDLAFMETYNAPGGKVNWHETQQCVGPQ